LNRKAPGKPPLLTEVQRGQLAAMIERGPIPAVDGVVRWRLIDLAQWLYATHGIATELCWNLGDGALRRRSGLTVRLPRHRFGR
jgi:hypothetical protein